MRRRRPAASPSETKSASHPQSKESFRAVNGSSRGFVPKGRVRGSRCGVPLSRRPGGEVVEHDAVEVVQWRQGTSGFARYVRRSGTRRSSSSAVLCTTRRARLDAGRCAARTRSAPTVCCTCRARWISTMWVELLESGTNIVTTRGELFGGGRPWVTRDVQRSLQRGRRGGSPIYATVKQPGLHHRCPSVRAAVHAASASTQSRSRSSPTSLAATRQLCCSS